MIASLARGSQRWHGDTRYAARTRLDVCSHASGLSEFDATLGTTGRVGFVSTFARVLTRGSLHVHKQATHLWRPFHVNTHFYLVRLAL